MLRTKFLIQLLFALIITAGANAQSSFDKDKFDDFVSASVEAFDLPSLSMIIMKEGELIYENSIGLRGKYSDTSPPNQETMYAIASLSKAFTAASIGMLVDEGKLSFSDKVIDHLPWFEMNDPYVTANLTIEDLLCHRSGLITFDGDLLWYGSDYSRREAVERIRYRAPEYGFRSRFGYQNLMFMTAGEVIAEVSGMSWDDFVMIRILNPLGMTRTSSSYDRFVEDENFAKPHLYGEEIFTLRYDNSGATAALNSCAKDMSTWLNFWLDEGIVNGDTLLQPSTIRKLWQLHTPLGTSSFDAERGTNFKGYAQGWFVMDYQGNKVVHHGGGLPGYITKAVVVPDLDLSIIVLTNDMSSVPTMMMYAAIDAVEGRPIDDWSETFLEYKERSASAEAKAKEERLATKVENPNVLDPKAYVGVYEDTMYGKAIVEQQDDQLVLTFDRAQVLFNGKLTPWDAHAFRWDHQDPFLTYGIITFHVEGDQVNGFAVELPNYDFHFEKLDFKRLAQ